MESIQAQVLNAAVRLCRERGGWAFEVREIVRALPSLNAQSVRIHVTSRCCVNAPANHAHRWPYFRRLGRGRYEVMPAFRKTDTARPLHVREAQPAYGPPIPVRESLHAIVTHSGACYVGEVLEVPVVTQGRTLDETVANLREAVTLHLSGEDGPRLGVSAEPRLMVSYQTSLAK